MKRRSADLTHSIPLRAASVLSIYTQSKVGRKWGRKMRDTTSLCKTRGSSCPELGIPCPSGKMLLCCMTPSVQKPTEKLTSKSLYWLFKSATSWVTTGPRPREKKKKKEKKPLPKHAVDADELIYRRCFRNLAGTTSLAPVWLDLSKLRSPQAFCRTRVDIHCAEGQMGHAARQREEPTGS